MWTAALPLSLLPPRRTWAVLLTRENVLSWYLGGFPHIDQTVHNDRLTLLIPYSQIGSYVLGLRENLPPLLQHLLTL